MVLSLRRLATSLRVAARPSKEALSAELLEAAEVPLGFGDGTLLERDLRQDFVDGRARRFGVELGDHLASFDGIAFFFGETNDLTRRLRDDVDRHLRTSAAGDREHALGRSLSGLDDAHGGRPRITENDEGHEGDRQSGDHGPSITREKAGLRFIERHRETDPWSTRKSGLKYIKPSGLIYPT